MVPVIEQSLGSSAYLSIRAFQVLLAVPFHPSPHESGGTQELLSGDVTLAESMPATEDPPHLLEHIPREYVGIGAGAPILEGLELPDDMSPAKLADPFLVVGTVGGMVIGGDYPVENIAQNGSEYLRPSAGGYAEKHDQRRNENPKIASLSFAFPSSLIGIDIGRFGKGLSGLFHDRLELGIDPFDAVAHTSKAQSQPKEGVHDLHYASSADLVDRSEVGNGCVNSWAELTPCYF